MNYVWDLEKAASNLEKHGIHFADTVGVLEDEQTLSIEDPGDYGEERFVSVGVIDRPILGHGQPPGVSHP